MPTIFSPSQVISIGWQYTRKYFWTVLKLMAVAYLPSFLASVITMGMTTIPGATVMMTDPLTNMPTQELVGNYSTIAIVIGVLWFILTVRLGIWLIKSYLMILKDQKPVCKDLVVPFTYFWKLLWGGIVVAIMTLIWFVLFIIPGIYVAVRLSLFKYFIAEWYGAIESIEASRHATQWNFWMFYLVGILYFFVGLVWFIALVIWLLRAIPVIALAQTRIYTQLKANLPNTIKPLA